MGRHISPFEVDGIPIYCHQTQGSGMIFFGLLLWERQGLLFEVTINAEEQGGEIPTSEIKETIETFFAEQDKLVATPQ